MRFLELLKLKKEVKVFESVYGKFEKLKKTEESSLKIKLNNESKNFFAEFVKEIKNLKEKPKRVLLAGEQKTIVPELKKNILKNSRIITAGIGDSIDYNWDFNREIPDMGKFDLIISQAMFEHLLNPYKHFIDLTNLLNPNGTLMIHTVVPGFQYHRYPIDSLRFFPDWFEEMGKKMNLKIIKKYINCFEIFYIYLNKNPINNKID